MIRLETIIISLEKNLKQYHALYSKYDLAKSRANLHYLKELQEIKRGTK